MYISLVISVGKKVIHGAQKWLSSSHNMTSRIYSYLIQSNRKSFLNKGFCLRYVLTVYVTIKTLVFLELMSCPKI